MAKQFYLYGSSPDALANSQFGYDQFYTRTAEGNRAASSDAQRFNIQAFLQAQAADEDARQRDAAMRANIFQNEMARRAAAEQGSFARAIDARNFDAMQREAEQNRTINAPVIQAQVDYTKAQTKSLENNNNTKIGHELATRAAEQGLILSPEDAEKKFKLPKETATLYFERSKDVQNAIDAQDAELTSAAKIMTAFTQANERLKTLAANPVDDEANQQIKAKAEQVVSLLQPRVAFLQNNRRQDILNQLEVDPQTGAYTPIVPKRPWRTGKTAGTGTSGGSSAFFNQTTATAGGYSTAQQVKDALAAGKISRQEALGVLRDQFGFE